VVLPAYTVGAGGYVTRPAVMKLSIDARFEVALGAQPGL
jgi:hypothetical protein